MVTAAVLGSGPPVDVKQQALVVVSRLGIAWLLRI